MNIINLYPDYAQVYYNFGKHKQNIEQYKEALALYKIGVKLNPLDKQSYYNMGFCSIQIEQYEYAIDYFSKSISIDNSFLLAYHARAYIYDLLNKTEKARLDWKHCLMLEPSYIPALKALSSEGY